MAEDRQSEDTVTTDYLRKEVRKRLAAKSWTQPRLAKAAAISTDRLKLWLKGRGDLKQAEVVRMLNRLGVRPEVQERQAK